MILLDVYRPFSKEDHMKTVVKEVLQRFNHWRKKFDKIDASAPRTVEDVTKKEGGKAFHASDCSADPCSCTGCSEWD